MKTNETIKQPQLFVESIGVSSSSNSLHFPYKEIVVNGHDLYIEKNITGKQEVKYYVTREENKIIKDIYFLEGVPNDESYATDGFIDLGIEVNGKKYIRSCENFFILEGMKDELIKNFFDAIASRYDSLIDKELNEKIIKIMLVEIERIINESKNNFSNKIKLLDYGVGTGISFEIFKFYEEMRNEVKALNEQQRVAEQHKKFLERKDEEKIGLQHAEKNKNLNNANERIRELQRKIEKNLQELNKISELLEKGELSGCDISERMLEQCKHKGFFYVSPVEYSKTGFEENYFDVILSVFVVHYFYNKEPYEEIYRIIKPGGLFIFNTKPYEFKNGTSKHKKKYDDVRNELSLIFGSIKRCEFIVKTAEKTRIVPIYICRKNIGPQGNDKIF